MILRASAILALSIALALAEVMIAAEMAPESQRTDFTCRWTPDFARWQGIERLLDLQDASWVVRQAVGRVNAVEEITQSGDELVVEMDVSLPLPGKVQRCPFDNRLHDDRTPLGRPSRSRHYWADEHTLVHVYEFVDETVTPYTLTARRHLIDSDTMRIDVVASVPGEPDHNAVQVYSRVRNR
ncbi:MAG: hypothetical protein E6J87_22095 [Deltaproteobacteria bacterium]|nr:MAG: hypothetical protein E6J87_22095 [Deltaproteobacteria bacterium]